MATFFAPDCRQCEQIGNFLPCEGGGGSSLCSLNISKVGNFVQNLSNPPISLGLPFNVIKLRFKPYDISDRLTIKYQNDTVFDTGCESSEIETYIKVNTSASAVIEVRVTSDCDNQTGEVQASSWELVTSCPAGTDLGEARFDESHGWEECPSASKPCPGGGLPGEDPNNPSASCSSAIIGPKRLYSSGVIDSGVLDFYDIKAAVVMSADNFGNVRGKNSSVGCPPSDACTMCSAEGVLTAMTQAEPENKTRAYVTAFGQNAPHGGPYSLAVVVKFSLEPK